jgi:hypothetical protein
MKKLFFMFSILAAFSGRSQTVYYPFENQASSAFMIDQYFGFDTAVANMIFFFGDSLWQVGAPSKQIFDEAWSPPNVLMTDTLLPYPDSVNSWFTLKFFPYNMCNLFVSWNQRVDVGIGDSCIIELSSDGIQWFDVYNFWIANQFYDLHYYKTNLTTTVSEFETLDSGCFFTDTVTGWYQYSLWFHYVFPLKDELFTDSLFMRFRFTSGLNTGNREGWMIDDICTGSFFYGWNIAEYDQSREILVYPNPSSEFFSFQAEGIVFPVQLLISDISGKLVSSMNVHSNRVDTGCLPDGLYYLKIRSANGIRFYSKFTKVR